jgi:hypothetical protein
MIAITTARRKEIKFHIQTIEGSTTPDGEDTIGAIIGSMKIIMMAPLI